MTFSRAVETIQVDWMSRVGADSVDALKLSALDAIPI